MWKLLRSFFFYFVKPFILSLLWARQWRLLKWINVIFFYFQCGQRPASFARVITTQWLQSPTWIIRRWTFKRPRVAIAIEIVNPMVSLNLVSDRSLSSKHALKRKRKKFDVERIKVTSANLPLHLNHNEPGAWALSGWFKRITQMSAMLQTKQK